MGREFRHVETNGVTLRVAVEGEGPLVLMAHGFPESWYSWRHQMTALAAAGYMAAAPDVRGYGGSDAPEAIEDYSLEKIAADMAAAAKALSPDAPAVMVGHDWGAPIAYHSALRHPEQFRAICGLSVPYRPMGQKTILDITKETFIDKGKFFYLHYFQEPGKAEAELDGDVTRAIRTMYYGWSGDAPKGYFHNNRPPTSGLLEGIDPPPAQMPDWFSEDDQAYYIGEFERVGFRGALNRYRNFERDAENTRALPSQVIEQPGLFIGGTKDPALVMAPPNLADAMRDVMPNLEAAHMLEGIGHWVQQEDPETVNRLMLDWLGRL